MRVARLSLNRILVFVGVVALAVFAFQVAHAEMVSGTVGGVNYWAYSNPAQYDGYSGYYYATGEYESAAITGQWLDARGYTSNGYWHQIANYNSYVPNASSLFAPNSVLIGGPDCGTYYQCYGTSRHDLVKSSSFVTRYTSTSGSRSCANAHTTAGGTC